MCPAVLGDKDSDPQGIYNPSGGGSDKKMCA